MIEMTNEEIIQIAHKYLYHYDTELGQWELNEESIEDIMEFARAIRKHMIEALKEWLPTERVENKYDADYNAGWNDCLDVLRKNLK